MNPKAVAIELDKPRALLFGAKAMMALKRVGLDVAKLTEPEANDPEVVVKLIWACLLHEDPELTAEQVVDLIDASAQSWPDITALLMKTLEKGLVRKAPA